MIRLTRYEKSLSNTEEESHPPAARRANHSDLLTRMWTACAAKTAWAMSSSMAHEHRDHVGQHVGAVERVHAGLVQRSALLGVEIGLEVR